MKGTFPIDKFREIQTPFYYYDTNVLRQTLKTINAEAGKHEGFEVHYAVKANANPKVLNIICQAGLGADCVSGGEIRGCHQCRFPANKIVYAGVGKSDWEINLGLDKGIFCFNVESVPELEIINELAEKKNKIAQVCFRINPDVGAHTHANITTGLAENKFGIAMRDMESVIEEASKMKNIKFLGLHFHIGSQILDMGDFEALCNRNQRAARPVGGSSHRSEEHQCWRWLGYRLQPSKPCAYPRFQGLLRYIRQEVEVARWTEVTLRVGTCRSGSDGFAHHQDSLYQAGHSQAVCHRRCRYDRSDPSCPLSGIS